MHRVLLDRNPRAAVPKDRSILAAPPPFVVAAGAIPPFTTDDGEITFLSPAGEVIKRISLQDDPNIQHFYGYSSDRRRIVIGRTFAAHLNASEKSEGGEWPMQRTVHDESGRAMYTTTQGSDDRTHLANSGAMVFDNRHTGEVTFVEPTSGANIARFQFMGGYGSGAPKVAIANSGERVIIGAGTTSLDGDRSVAAYRKNPKEYFKLAKAEVWVAVFDGRAKELWRTKLPGAAGIETVALSDDGSFVFVHGRLSDESPLLKPENKVGNIGYLLDSAGRVMAHSDRWGSGASGAEFSAELGGFVLGAWSLKDVLTLDGELREIFGGAIEVPRMRDMDPLDHAIRPCLSAFLGFRKQRILLALVDRSGQVQLLKNIDGHPKGRDDEDGEGTEPEEETDPHRARLEPSARDTLRGQFGVTLSPDASLVSVRIEREIRIYRILPRGRRRGETGKREGAR